MFAYIEKRYSRISSQTPCSAVNSNFIVIRIATMRSIPDIQIHSQSQDIILSFGRPNYLFSNSLKSQGNDKYKLLQFF